MNALARKIIISFLSFALLVSPVFAEEELVVDESESLEIDVLDEELLLAEEEPPISPDVNADSQVELNRNIIFDASATTSTYELETLSFEWFFGDGNRQEGIEVVHSYAEPGEYEVNLIVRNEVGEQISTIQPVFVYERAFALITNVDSAQDRIHSFVDTGKNEFVYVELIEAYSSQSEFLAEEDLLNAVTEQLAALENMDQIVVWTEGSSGLTLFSQLKQSVSEDFFSEKEILFVSEQDFGSLSNIASGVYETVQPKEIILTRPEAVWVLFESAGLQDMLDILDLRGVSYERIQDGFKFRPWNFMSYIVNEMIERGVPSNAIRLILMLPVIVTVVAFMKQVVGLATLGVYTPSILALSFIALDLSYGLIILFAIVFIGTLTRLFLRRHRLLYIPRMAIVLTMVSITILFLLYFASLLGLSQVTSIAIFPMLVMSTLVEKFVSIQGGKGLRSALTLLGEMVLVAILCYYVAEWDWLKLFVLGHPEVIFLFLFANLFLARWSGLRILEHFRFREIIRYAEE
jgi:PKD repeat protein